jgi:hypothetical protein
LDDPGQIEISRVRTTDCSFEKEENMDRDTLLHKVTAYAERLVNAGNMASFEEVFGSTDPDFDVKALPDENLQWIYDEYVEE